MNDSTRPLLGTALVGVGGFAGATARYGVDLVLPSLAATLAVNVLGSLALGLLFYGNRRRTVLGPLAMRLTGTGFLSSFTTYSTFVVDAVLADPVVAGAHVLGSYLLGFGAVLLGRWGARWIGTGLADSGGVGP